MSDLLKKTIGELSLEATLAIRRQDGKYIIWEIDFEGESFRIAENENLDAALEIAYKKLDTRYEDK